MAAYVSARGPNGLVVGKPALGKAKQLKDVLTSRNHPPPIMNPCGARASAGCPAGSDAGSLLRPRARDRSGCVAVGLRCTSQHGVLASRAKGPERR